MYSEYMSSIVKSTSLSSPMSQRHAACVLCTCVNGSGSEFVCDVQSVHVKNRCAFLNHSSNAQEFMQLVEQHPNIALWFSVSPELPEWSLDVSL